MFVKSTLSSAAVVLCGALALSACGSSTPAASSGSTPSGGASASQPATAPGSSSASSSASSPTPPASSGTPSGSTATPTHGTGGATTSSSNATSDSYAYAHPCDIARLTMNVTRPNDAPTRRLIAVRNNGASACGLTYYPQIDIGDSRSADASHNIRPMIPGGLGGPPAFPVYAGQTAYAVIDLNPGGATTSAMPSADEMNVLAASTMPNASTLNFPLAGGTVVAKPKLGLYERSAADAAASMQGANTQP